ncbi:MAG: DUF2452 domain-containing protein [Halieaceae bacterium]|jgi:hypothetical protein|nr:DUF2452 domain-containing protein [Halieaceae bacterium]
MARRGNPQGKGLTPVLDQWRAAQPALIRRRNARQVIADYFTTLLVLSADFSFKPAPGVPYHLYLRGEAWELSLISPEEWRGRAPGPCLGRCELQNDMTWQLAPRGDIEEHPALAKALDAFHEGFLALLAREGALEDNLPHYIQHLPYYRRLLAAGMASSLKQSLALSGLSQRPGSDWLESARTPGLARPD